MTPTKRKAIEGILAYFNSGNALPVEKATIRGDSQEVQALRAALAEPVFSMKHKAKVLLTDDYGKPDEMPDEAWRQLTKVIPFRVREVMKGHLYSIDVLHESLNRVADYCLDGYGWSTGQWKPIGQYGVAIEKAVRQKAGLK